MDTYKRTHFAKRCIIPYSTLYGRLEEFRELFHPIEKDGELSYTKFDYYRSMMIQGMRSTKPAHSKENIINDIKEFNNLLTLLEELEELLIKRK